MDLVKAWKEGFGDMDKDYLVILFSSFLTILMMCIVFIPLGFLNGNILMDGDGLRFWTEMILPILTIFGAFGAIFVIIWQTNRHIGKIQYQIDEQKRVRSEAIRMLLPFHFSEMLAVFETYERVLVRLVDAGQGHYLRDREPQPLLDKEISEFRKKLSMCRHGAREVFELIAEFHSINTDKENKIGFVLNTMRFTSAKIEEYLDHRQFPSHKTKEILVTFENICIAHKYINDIFRNDVYKDLFVNVTDEDRSTYTQSVLMIHSDNFLNFPHIYSEFEKKYGKFGG